MSTLEKSNLIGRTGIFATSESEKEEIEKYIESRDFSCGKIFTRGLEYKKRVFECIGVYRNKGKNGYIEKIGNIWFYDTSIIFNIFFGECMDEKLIELIKDLKHKFDDTLILYGLFMM